MSEEPRNIILTGFMGTGKTTVGSVVAHALGWRFVDTDEEIERRFRQRIPDIFLHHGEQGFRRYESIIVQSVAAGQGQVIATGGGTLVDAHNFRLMQASGLLICLTADADVIEQRLGRGEGRPLASNWRDLLTARAPVYAALPHHIDTSKLAPEQAAQEVVQLWQKYR